MRVEKTMLRVPKTMLYSQMISFLDHFRAIENSNNSSSAQEAFKSSCDPNTYHIKQEYKTMKNEIEALSTIHNQFDKLDKYE